MGIITLVFLYNTALSVCAIKVETKEEMNNNEKNIFLMSIKLVGEMKFKVMQVCIWMMIFIKLYFFRAKVQRKYGTSLRGATCRIVREGDVAICYANK
jgi:hypothetical protein